MLHWNLILYCRPDNYIILMTTGNVLRSGDEFYRKWVYLFSRETKQESRKMQKFLRKARAFSLSLPRFKNTGEEDNPQRTLEWKLCRRWEQLFLWIEIPWSVSSCGWVAEALQRIHNISPNSQRVGRTRSLLLFCSGFVVTTLNLGGTSGDGGHIMTRHILFLIFIGPRRMCCHNGYVNVLPIWEIP